MAALADSGRSKLDVEISYSSSNLPPGLSTAEFANSSNQEQHPEPPPPPPQQHQSSSRPKPQQLIKASCSKDSHSTAAWGTKLRSVPLSIEFDVSVIATQDSHGRLTLQPVLRAAETSAAPAQGLTSRAAMPAQQAPPRSAAEGDLGRNNCATASITGPSVSQRPALHQLAETDLSTATRASCSEAHASAVKAATAVTAATAAAAITAAAVAPAQAPSAAACECRDLRQARPPQPPEPEDNRGNLNDRFSSTSLLSAALHAKHDTHTLSRYAGTGDGNKKLHHRRSRCADCQSALPRLTCRSSQSDTAAVDRRHRCHRPDSQLSSLARVVRKLESLLAAVDPHQRLAVASTDSASLSRRAGGSRRRALRNDLNVSDLRQEYTMLFRD